MHGLVRLCIYADIYYIYAPYYKNGRNHKIEKIF